jgi:translation elongation factor EF-4
MRVNFELDPTNAVLVSAKTGLNVEKVLPAVCENAPAYIYPHIQQLQYNLTLEI